MRQRKLDLQARVNGNLALDFGDVALTSYAGLELFARYLRRTRFNALVREVFRGSTPWGDYGVVAMVRLVVGLLIVGGRRLRHVAYVADDRLFRRFAGLRRLPTARTVSRWLSVLACPRCGARLRLVALSLDGAETERRSGGAWTGPLWWRSPVQDQCRPRHWNKQPSR